MTDAELAEVLRSSTDPLELARANVQIVARRLAADVEDGVKGKNEDRALKLALEELRRTEQGYLDLARQRGDLISRDSAKALAGSLAAQFVGALDRYEVAAAKQFEVWLADPAFAALGTDDRARAVRSWLRERSRAARLVAAEDLERRIAEEEAP